MIVGMSVPLVKIGTGMIVIEMIVQHIAGIALGHPHAVPNMKIVAPGLRPPGGTLMIEGLQGTMITDGGVMMIAEGLIIIMTDAGTN
jgi:hypothetical protein